ncbi:MAG: hypothetical protein ACREH3_04550 [Geminicoccales bacterium]
MLLAAAPTATFAQVMPAGATYPVGIRQIEFVDAAGGDRVLALALWMFYPAVVDEAAATPFVMPFFANLQLYQDAEALEGTRRPLVMFSHGRGSNGLYAWFAEFLAARGYIVAALNHYRANSYLLSKKVPDTFSR